MRHSVSTARGRGISSAYSGGSSTAADRSQMAYTSRARPSRSPARRVSSTEAAPQPTNTAYSRRSPGRNGVDASAPAVRGDVGRDHGSDARGEPPGQLPYRPAPQR